jgi:hypothetical protein
MYLKEVLHPELVRRGAGKNGKVALLILDGVITHCSHELILWCQANHICLVLRPPNTSSATQPEDVVHFKNLKQAWVDFKNARLLQRVLDHGECSISWEDVVEGARLAWEHAFTAHLIKKSWRAVGLIPFTRRVEIKLRRKEAAHSLSVSKSKVKVMSLNTALKNFAASGSGPALPVRKDQGRSKGGRLDFGKPLTSKESVAIGLAEAAVKQAALDKTREAKEKREKAQQQRGEAAAAKLAAGKGDPGSLRADELKDFLRWKGVASVELQKNRAALEDLYRARFIVEGALQFQSFAQEEALPLPEQPAHAPEDEARSGDSDTTSERFGDGDAVPADVRELNAEFWDSEKESDQEGDSSDQEGDSSDSDDESVKAVPMTKSETLDGTYEAEEIVDGPNAAGKYLVKWVGFSSKENTWEPVGHLQDPHSQKLLGEWCQKRIQEEEVPLAKAAGLLHDC